MSSHQQHPETPEKSIAPGGRVGLWAADEIEALLADPRSSGRLGQVLAAAAGTPREADQQNAQDAAVRAFRTAFDGLPSGKPLSVGARLTGRAAVAILAGGLVLSGGAAAAAVALPGASQTAKNVLAKVGLGLPGSAGHSSRHTPVRSTASPTPVPKDRSSTATAANPRPGSGRAISDLAHSTATTGVDKGAAVSGAASDGRSQAGQHGKATTRSTGEAARTPRPNLNRGHRHGTPPRPTSSSAHAPTKGDSGTPSAAPRR